MKVQIRSFTYKALPSLVNLLNKTYSEAYEFIPHTEESLQSRIKERKLIILMAVEKDEILGSIAYNDGYWGEEIEWLTVLKGTNRKAIESKLVEETEKYVKGQAVFTVVDAESSKINEWVERGYMPENGLYHMAAGLEGLKPLPRVPEGTVLRSLKPNEEKELIETVNTGFGWERLKVGVIERWKTEHPAFSEEWIHVAEIGQKIVSVVVSKPDTEYNQFFKAKRGYLGPAATLLEHRTKNLASALTCRAMNFLFERGFDSGVLYTTEQNTPSIALLQKLGFKIGHHWKFLRKNIPKPV